MPYIIALAVCFLFFCHAPIHRHVAKSLSCAEITKDYNGDQDAWVSQFPVNQQHRALICLERLRGK